MFDLSKLQIGRTTRKLEFFLHIIPRFLSTTPILVPEHQQVSQLILEQKSADQALQTFEWASKIPSFIHTQSTYRALVHKLCTFQRFEAVKQLLDEMPKRIGTPADDDIFITIVRGYGRARMTREVIGVLHMVTKFGNGNPSLKLLNSILDFLVKEDIDIAREFYRNKIMRTGMKGDDYTYGILMKGFCLTNRIGDGFKLLQVMKNHGLKVNPVVYNTLLYALCKNGKVGRARSLMNEMTEFSDVTFNILISAYCNENNLVQALVMLDKCFDNNFVPDVVALTKVVEILCNAERMSEAVELLEKFDEEKGKVDVVVYNTLIKGFIRAGKLNSGCGLLEKMEMKGCLPNTDTYNVLITGSCESGMFDSALELFHEMETVGLNRNFGTFETLIYGLCSCGRTDDGYKILDLMNKGSRRKYDNLGCYNSILYGLYKEDRLYEAVEFLNDMRKLFPIVVNRSLKILKCSQIGSLEEAKQALEKMSKEGTIPCAFVCASLIQGFCANALMKQAVELMNKMIGHGYFPNAYTFNALLRGFCSEGKVGAAVKLLDDMNLRGCIIDSESYGIIISDFCSHGEMEKAYVLFMQMVERGIAPDSCLWNVLIWVLLKRDSKHEYELLQSLINT